MTACPTLGSDPVENVTGERWSGFLSGVVVEVSLRSLMRSPTVATEKPFMVVRGAGSLGVDLVAISAGLSLPIEVKSSTSDVLRFSRNEKLAIQAQEMIDDCRRVGLMPIYAFRYKRQRGDAWRIFTLDVGPLNGRLKPVYQRLPKIMPSKEGNLIMRWNDGMPLSRFIDYVVALQS